MTEENKLYAHVYQFLSTASGGMKDYIHKNQNEVIRADHIRLEVFCKNGDVHFFMTKAKYLQWCRGRTYIMDGKWHHSGTELAR